MDFVSIVKVVLNEDMVAGGAGSVFGPGVTSTATEFSGDNYAKGDARNVVGGVAGTVLTRMGPVGKKKKTKNKKKKSSKKRRS